MNIYKEIYELRTRVVLDYKKLEEIRNTLSKVKILFSTICIRGKENMSKEIYGFDLPREKLFTYSWETVEMKENHPN